MSSFTDGSGPPVSVHSQSRLRGTTPLVARDPMHLSFTSNDVLWDRLSGRRNSVANMVDRILKGEKPREIPIF